MKQNERNKCIIEISKHFTYIEDLLEYLTDTELKRINENCENNEY